MFFGPTLAHLSAMLAHLGGHVGPSWRLRWGHVGPFWPKRPKREKSSKTRVLSISDGSAATGRARFSFGEGVPAARTRPGSLAGLRGQRPGAADPINTVGCQWKVGEVLRIGLGWLGLAGLGMLGKARGSLPFFAKQTKQRLL